MCFVGRDDELERLRRKNWRGHADLTVIYGRRRVGKTALVQEAFRDEVLWKFEGLEKVNEGTQIQSFHEQLCTYAPVMRQKASPQNWREAFLLLSEALGRKSVVVFFDEFQWLANLDPAFVSLFKYFWDNYFQRHERCRFIICGSVSSFIVEKVLRSRALYGRMDLEIHLEPLLLKEIRAFFPQRSLDEVLQIAMTFGGVPKYLLALDPSLSFLQNLNAQAFHQNGFFFEEFHRLFISHLASSPHYPVIVKTLTQKQATLDDLAKSCHVTKGGQLAGKVQDLVLADFIEKDQPVGKGINSRIVRYRILDEYLHFYFRFISPNVAKIQQRQYQFRSITDPELAQWQGYAFERLCWRQRRRIAERLQFGGVVYESGSWFERGLKGAQVDLLFKRADQVLTVCEMKHVQKLQVAKIAQAFEKKLAVLREVFPRHSLHRVLMLGKREVVTPALARAFDDIIFAEELF